MTYRLILLGLLAERPHYGYELQQAIAHRNFAEYVRLSGGGLYYHLRKLCAEGHIAEEAVARSGNYPDRHTYRITAQGQTYLYQLLRETLDDVAGRRQYDPLDAALALGGLLPPREIVARLQRQVDQLRAQVVVLAALDQLQSVLPQYVDLYGQLIVEHAIHRLTGGINWLESAIARIQETMVSAPRRLLTRTAARAQLAEQAHLPLERLGAVAEPYEAAFQQNAAHGYGTMRAAQAAYHQTLSDAWQGYESTLRMSGPDGEYTHQAHEAYTHQVAAAWHTFNTAVQSAQQGVSGQFTATAAAFEQALTQAAADLSPRPQSEGVQP